MPSSEQATCVRLRRAASGSKAQFPDQRPRAGQFPDHRLRRRSGKLPDQRGSSRIKVIEPGCVTLITNRMNAKFGSGNLGEDDTYIPRRIYMYMYTHIDICSVL